MKYLRNAGKPKISRCNTEEDNNHDDEQSPKRTKKEYKQFPQLTTEPPIPAGLKDTILWEISTNYHVQVKMNPPIAVIRKCFLWKKKRLIPVIEPYLF